MSVKNGWGRGWGIRVVSLWRITATLLRQILRVASLRDAGYVRCAARGLKSTATIGSPYGTSHIHRPPRALSGRCISSGRATYYGEFLGSEVPAGPAIVAVGFNPLLRSKKNRVAWRRNLGYASSMANTYARIIIHYVWSTKNRMPLINSSIEQRLWAYIAGIANQRGIKSIKIGGMEDHVHVVLELAKDMTISDTAKHLKGHSSRWMNKEGLASEHFTWQDGFGAFSVSPSSLGALVDYVENQREHHKIRTFQEEYLEFLNKHGVKYDDRYVLG